MATSHSNVFTAKTEWIFNYYSNLTTTIKEERYNNILLNVSIPKNENSEFYSIHIESNLPKDKKPYRVKIPIRVNTKTQLPHGNVAISILKIDELRILMIMADIYTQLDIDPKKWE